MQSGMSAIELISWSGLNEAKRIPGTRLGWIRLSPLHFLSLSSIKASGTPPRAVDHPAPQRVSTETTTPCCSWSFSAARVGPKFA